MDNASCARALRESKGVKFSAIVDGEARALSTSRTKGRWERLAALALSLGAESVECFDASGAMVSVVRLEEQPTQAASQKTETRKGATEMEALFALVMESADRQVARYSASVEQVLSSTTRVLEAVTRRMEALDERAEASLKAREDGLRSDVLALTAMAESVQAERAAVDEALTQAVSEKTAEDSEGAAMVAKLLEPLGAAVAAKVMGGA